MTTKQRRTTEQRIEEIKIELKRLEERLKIEKNPNSSTLNRDSEGVKDAIAALTKVVQMNRSSMGEVIKLISKIKRTGLQILDPKKKTKKLERLNKPEIENKDEDDDDELESKDVSIDDMLQAIRERRKLITQE